MDTHGFPSQQWREIRQLTPARIVACRTELGLSQQGFAELIAHLQGGGLPSPAVSTISRWEHGVKPPGIMWGPTVLRLVKESEARRAAQNATGLAGVR